MRSLINMGWQRRLLATHELAKPTHLAYQTSKFLLPLWKSGSLPGCPVKLWCSLAHKSKSNTKDNPFVSV